MEGQREGEDIAVQWLNGSGKSHAKAERLTSYGGEDSVSKETVPLLPFVGLPAPLRNHPAPVPGGTGVKGTNISHLLAVHLCQNQISRRASILDASLDGLSGGAAHCVHAVGAVVLLVVQEPAGIGQASHLYAGVSQAPQQLGHVVHVEKNAGAAGAARHRNTTRVAF